MFPGQSKRISKKERDARGPRVQVMFQANARSDGTVMKEWVESEWSNVFTNPAPVSATDKLLVMDMHRAQQSDDVKQLLTQRKTSSVAVPAGWARVNFSHWRYRSTSHSRVPSRGEQHEEHQHENLQLYTDGKISASESHVLITTWVANG